MLLCADGLRDADVATQLLAHNEALRAMLQQDPSDATPEVSRLAAILQLMLTAARSWCCKMSCLGLLAFLQPAVLLGRVQALLLALRLWPLMSQALRASCPLLPAVDIPNSSAAGGTSRTTAYVNSAEGAGAFFNAGHLAKLLPVLRATTAAHPRLHLLWPTVLALLLPGFAPKRVGGPKTGKFQGGHLCLASVHNSTLL